MMSACLRPWVPLTLTFCFSFAPAIHAQEANAGTALPLTVRNGTVSFTAKTNLSAITVHGESKALRATASVLRGERGLTIRSITATVPVETLETGMGLRDKHMRTRVFTAAGGSLPAIQFTAESSECAKTGKQGEFRCPVAGSLVIQNTPRPFSLQLDVREQKAGKEYKANGTGVVKLSDYDIERPSQLGVTVEDPVEVQIEFTGTLAAADQTPGRAK